MSLCYKEAVSPGAYYERNLPHWHPAGSMLFVTWRLYGSLPAHVWNGLCAKKHISDGQKYVLADRELDKALTGPVWLKDPQIADCIVEALRRGEKELKLFDLHAFVVMANHVHILVTPRVPLARITRGIKRHTAAEANEMLGLRGKRFWQDESFDHWIRTGREAERVKLYIEWNAVKAGLVQQPEEWAWSSASRRWVSG